eukprot:gene5508-9325_t
MKLPIVKLFTKIDCCLCDTAKFILKKIQVKVPFQLQEIDITQKGNEKYFELYKYDIPVIFVNNKEACRHKINETVLRKALEENVQQN